MIDRFFTKEFTVKRFTWAGDSSASLSTQGTLNGHLQQETDENMAEWLGLRISEVWKLWCPLNTDIVRQDRIVDPSSDEYLVRFIQEKIVGYNKHLEVTLEKIVSEYE